MSSELEHLASLVADGKLPADSQELPQGNFALLARISAAFGNADEPPAQPRESLFEWRHLSVEEELGAGGFGVVYRAWDPVLRRAVALKLVHEGRDKIRNEWIMSEARRMARVRHPNVLAIHGADEADGRAGIWCDLIEGETLDQLLERDGPLVAEQALTLAIALCGAVNAIHLRMLSHGDIKPANVMLKADGEPVLMDFGAACQSPGGPAFGSPIVMAPELFDNAAPTPASDMYALGALLYRATTGQYPLEAESFEDLAVRHEGRAAIDLTQVPKNLRDVIGACLERNAARRPGAAQLNADLLELVEAPARRRRRWATGLIIGFLTTTLVATGVGLKLTADARSVAEDQRAQAEASLDFVTSMLEAPSLDKSGSEVKMREVLDAAARQVTQSNPAIRARLHFVLARTYHSLSQYDQASTQFALAAQHADSARFRAGILRNQIDLENNRGQYEAADKLIERLAELAREEGLYEYTLKAQLARAQVANSRGQRKDALALARAVESANPGFAPDNPAWVRLWSLLVGLLRDESEIDAALDYSRKALRWSEQYEDTANLYGAFNARYELSSLLIVAGRLEEAETMSLELLQELDAMTPDLTFDKLAVSSNLIAAIGGQGRTDEALERNQSLLKLAQETPGIKTTALISIAGNLGVRHFERGEYAAAARVTADVLKWSEQTYGADGTETRLYSTNLAEMRVYQGAEGALATAQDAYQTNVGLFGNTHIYSLFAADVYALALIRGARAQQGLALLDTTIARKQTLFGADNAFTWDSHAYRAEALLALNRVGEAHTLASQVVSHREKTLAPTDLKLAASRRLLEQIRSAMAP